MKILECLIPIFRMQSLSPSINLSRTPYISAMWSINNNEIVQHNMGSNIRVNNKLPSWVENHTLPINTINVLHNFLLKYLFTYLYRILELQQKWQLMVLLIDKQAFSVHSLWEDKTMQRMWTRIQSMSNGNVNSRLQGFSRAPTYLIQYRVMN